MSGPFFLPFDSEKFTMLVYVCRRNGSDVVAGLKTGSGSAKHMPKGARFLTSSCVRTFARFLEPSSSSIWPGCILKAARQFSTGIRVAGFGSTGTRPVLVVAQNGPHTF